MVTNYPAGTEQYSNNQFNSFLDRILTTFNRTVRPVLDLDVNQNATYTEDDLLDLLLHIAVRGDFANRGAKTRAVEVDNPAIVRTDHRSKSAKALGRQLRHLSRPAIKSQFRTALAEILGLARQAHIVPNAVDIAIDIHDWPYYGDEDATPMVVGTNRIRGTQYAFRFVTACIVTAELRLTVGVVPLCKLSHLGEVVEQLLTGVPDWVRVRRVFLDRGFHNVQVINALEDHDCEYLIRSRKIPSLSSDTPTTEIDREYRMEQGGPPYDTARVTRFTVPSEDATDDQLYFLTNMAIDEPTAETLAEVYSRRWGIETSYRVIGDFLPKTTSRRYPVRLYYFLFAVMLYNLWILCNQLLAALVNDHATSTLLPSTVFGELLRRELHGFPIEPG